MEHNDRRSDIAGSDAHIKHKLETDIINLSMSARSILKDTGQEVYNYKQQILSVTVTSKAHYLKSSYGECHMKLSSRLNLNGYILTLYLQ